MLAGREMAQGAVTWVETRQSTTANGLMCPLFFQ
jgi:hypothetical protein